MVASCIKKASELSHIGSVLSGYLPAEIENMGCLDIIDAVALLTVI